MSALLDLASALLLAAGALFCLVGGVGLLRMPEFYTRLHAASLCDSTGAMFVLLGLALQAGWTLAAAKLAVIALLLFFTGPAAAHALARAALARGLAPRLACGESAWKR